LMVLLIGVIFWLAWHFAGFIWASLGSLWQLVNR
jgi:hypothetical protein